MFRFSKHTHTQICLYFNIYLNIEIQFGKNIKVLDLKSSFVLANISNKGNDVCFCETIFMTQVFLYLFLKLNLENLRNRKAAFLFYYQLFVRMAQ